MLKRKLAIVMALLVLNLSMFASIPLDRGTALSIRITSQISSKSKVTPTAIVENDVKDRDSVILIKRGTPVQLQIDKKKAKGCGKAGYVQVKCVSTSAVDGQSIALEGSMDAEGDNKKGLAIGLGVGLGLTVLPGIGFAFLAIKGEQAVIPANTVIPNVFVMNDYTIEK